MLEAGTCYYTRGNGYAHNLQDTEDGKVMGEVSILCGQIVDSTNIKDYAAVWQKDGLILEVRLSDKLISPGPEFDILLPGIELQRSDLQKLVDDEFDEAFLADADEAAATVVDMSNVDMSNIVMQTAGSMSFDGSYIVPTALNIRGREFALGDMDASVPQVVLDALHQAFKEIDELKEEIEIIKQAPAITNDV